MVTARARLAEARWGTPSSASGGSPRCAPHVRHAAARSHVPVDRPDVVAGLILAHLREFDAAAVEGGMVITRKAGADQTGAEKLQLAHPSHQRLAMRNGFAAEEAEEVHGQGWC